MNIIEQLELEFSAEETEVRLVLDNLETQSRNKQVFIDKVLAFYDSLHLSTFYVNACVYKPEMGKKRLAQYIIEHKNK